ncbi:hypothetical protein ACTHAM_002410 [Cellulomonas soli]|uniref:hypothetical protein n=1 Tax=Cellulomonas soli TaxID=931535 RepID=UPI003F82BC3A
MALIGWVDPEVIDVATEWRDAPSDDAVLARYLSSAYDQCLAFLPHARDALTGELVPVVPDPVPDRLRLAQIMQARALYNGAVSGPNDQQGEGSFGVTVFPMDWTVKNLLRPKRLGMVL